MTTKKDASIKCSGSELLYLSAILGGQQLIGVADPFPGWLTEEIQVAMDKARISLSKRQYLVMKSKDQIILDAAVAALVGTLTVPDATLLLTLTTPNSKPKQFSFYWRDPLVVELARERSEMYKLKSLDGVEEIYERVLEIWNIERQKRVKADTFSVSETVLAEARRLISKGKIPEAKKVLGGSHTGDPSIRAFFKTLIKPERNGSFVLLQKSELSWSVSGLGMLEGANALWRLRSFEGQGNPWIQAIPCDASTLAAEVRSVMSRYVPLRGV